MGGDRGSWSAPQDSKTVRDISGSGSGAAAAAAARPLAITIGFSQEDEDPDTCYICLSSEGPMLVNMCACRSLRAHRSCLLELTRRQTGPPVCGVCRQEICPEELELSLPAVEPVAPGSQWGKTLRVTSQIVNVIFGAPRRSQRPTPSPSS